MRDTAVAVSCEEIHEQITSYVDNRIDESEYRQRVAGHIRRCPECRAAYERELLTKMVVRERYPRAATPQSTRAAIEQGLDRISTTSTASTSLRDDQPRGNSGRWLMIVGLVLLVGLGVWLALGRGGDDAAETAAATEVSSEPEAPPPPPRSTAPSFGVQGDASVNFFNKATTNFNDLREGLLKVEIPASSLADLKQKLTAAGVGSIEFPGVSLPVKGGAVSKQGNSAHAHILLSDDDTWLYAYEVPWNDIVKENGVYLTPDVAEQISNGEFVMVEPEERVHAVVYKRGNSAIAVVANRSEVDLKKLLGLS